MFSVKGQMPISIWTIIAIRERTMLTCLSVYQIPLGFRDHHRTSLGHLWAICGFQSALFTFPFLDVLLYVIGVLNTQRFGAFVSNIGEFGG